MIKWTRTRKQKDDKEIELILRFIWFDRVTFDLLYAIWLSGAEHEHSLENAIDQETHYKA